MISGTHIAIEDDRNSSILININGKLFKRDDAKISVFDSGYLIGDGIWEAFRLYNGILVFIDSHLDRLWQGAQAIGMQLDFSRDEIIDRIWQTLRANKMHSNVHIRLMVTRGLKKTPSQDPRLTISGPNVVILPEYKTINPIIKKRGISLFTSSIRRGSPDYLDPRLNCHSKIHEVQALLQALEAGADEALMLDVNGFVSTCNSTNFFIIKNNEVWTSSGQYCMNGITRQKIIDICHSNQIVCREKNFSLIDVYNSEEAFVTGTFGGLTPVVKIDGRRIANGKPGKLTYLLDSLYNNLINKVITSIK